MSISAIIPVAHLASANATLTELGHGPCFSVPLRTGTADATHAGLHAWTDPVLLASLQSIPNAIISTDGEGSDLFAAHTIAQALEWSDPTLWHLNPVMKGDTRSYNGKNWESLVDYNVWTPPVAWREIVATGYPAWIQPTGAHDSYPLGFEVMHDGVHYVSDRAANVWQPGTADSGWRVFGEEPGEEWIDTGVTITQLVASGIYRVSGIPTIAFDQAIRLGDTTAGETVFVGYWPTTGTPSDYIKIAPHVTALVGSKLWIWE